MAGIVSKLLSLLTKGKTSYGPLLFCHESCPSWWEHISKLAYRNYRGKRWSSLAVEKKMARSVCKSPFRQVKCLGVWSLLVVCCLSTLPAEFLPVLLPPLGPASSCNNPISRFPLGKHKRIVLGWFGLLYLEWKFISGFSDWVQELSVSLAIPVGLKSETTISCLINPSLHKGFLS